MHTVGGVVFRQGDEHVGPHFDLTVEVEVNLLVGVEVVHVEFDLRQGLPGGCRFAGGQQGA